MNEDISHYEGREQTYIKHQFLIRYLEGAAYKIFQRRSRVFNFIDAFAGPWRVDDKRDFTGASFAQALKILDAVKRDLSKDDPVDIYFCFCEKRPEAVAQLRDYAQKKTDFHIHIFEGKFEDNLDKISKALPGGFTFTFIDPSGWDISNEKVFDFLRQQDGEFLFNFMSDHINRHSGFKGVEASFGRLLADPSWIEKFNELPSDLSNEERVLFLLKKRMKETGAAKYFPDFSIMLPRKERLKMRLLLGTNSPIGVELFRDIQLKIEKRQIEVRHRIRKSETLQSDLFSEPHHVEDYVEFVQEQQGVGSERYRKKAEKRIIEILRNRGKLKYGDIRLDSIERISIRKTDVNKLIGDMKERGIVSFDLPSGTRVPQPQTWISLPSDDATAE